MARDVEIRPLKTLRELQQAVELQRLTWGESFTECVPATILQIAQKVGGVSAGAFDSASGMLGFVFGLSGIQDGRLVHWSHMLAVRPEARGLGLGKRMKRYQREVLLALGIDEVRWTFDPLVAQNANLNLNALGAEIEAYIPDMYGADTRSDLHSGLGTDRFVALWHIGDPQVERILAGEVPGSPVDLDSWAGAVTSAAATASDADAPLPEAARVRIEVPADIQAVKARDPAAARRWRAATRRAFLWYLARGYRVTGFARDAVGQSFYLLTRRAQERA